MLHRKLKVLRGRTRIFRLKKGVESILEVNNLMYKKMIEVNIFIIFFSFYLKSILWSFELFESLNH